MADDRSVNPRLILASGSPQRRRLMDEAGYVFEVVKPTVAEPERLSADISPAQQAEALSYFKARSVIAQVQSGLIIGADTIVVCQGQVFGKPTDLDEARSILATLMGTSQQIITGVTVLNAASRERLIAHNITTVVMRSLSGSELEEYLATGEWAGKAGAYGIQGQADAFVERIEGSFSNVVGLPIELLAGMLAERGYHHSDADNQPLTANS